MSGFILVSLQYKQPAYQNKNKRTPVFSDSASASYGFAVFREPPKQVVSLRFLFKPTQTRGTLKTKKTYPYVV